MKKEKPIIISVGGSLIVPDNIDISFLKIFKNILLEQISKGRRFVLITGGGQTARRYQKAGQAVTDLSVEDLDWLGIHGTRLNGHLLRSIFYQEAHPVMVKNPTALPVFEESLLVAAGWRPGRSTDYCAVSLAKTLGSDRIINLSNIDYVYEEDPQKNIEAEFYDKISWVNFLQLIPKDWNPGLSTPFDPEASRLAQAENMEVIIINGQHLERLDNYLNNLEFKGTVISNKFL